MRVGNEIHIWQENKVILFDDSFEHEVVNPTNEERVVLLVDIWHPDLNEKERELIRKDFKYIKKNS
jgi:aspartyl/asparaginyl beta-hydroxylase (cupin superfamily)